MIQRERIRLLNTRPFQDGEYVLYWMQQSQRAEFNHAVEYAVQQANQLGQPVLVVFGLMARILLHWYRFGAVPSKLSASR